MLLDFQQAAVAHAITRLARGEDALIVLEADSGTRCIAREVLVRLGVGKGKRALVIFPAFEDRGRTARAYRHAPWPSVPLSVGTAETQRDLSLLVSADPSVLLIKDDIPWQPHTIVGRDVLVIHRAELIRSTKALRALRSAPGAPVLLLARHIDFQVGNILAGYPGHKGSSEREDASRANRLKAATFVGPKNSSWGVAMARRPIFFIREVCPKQTYDGTGTTEADVVFQQLSVRRENVKSADALLDIESVTQLASEIYERRDKAPDQKPRKRSGRCPCCGTLPGERSLILNISRYLSTLTSFSTCPRHERFLWREQPRAAGVMFMLLNNRGCQCVGKHDPGLAPGVALYITAIDAVERDKLARILMTRADSHVAVGTAWGRPDQAAGRLAEILALPWFLPAMRRYLEPQLVILLLTSATSRMAIAEFAPFVSSLHFAHPPSDLSDAKKMAEALLGTPVQGRPKLRISFDASPRSLSMVLARHLLWEATGSTELLSAS